MPSIKLIGVLNVTPDSFSDGALYIEHEKALAHAKQLVSEGANIIEIGGDSTRPGSTCVGPEQEWERIGGLISEISAFVPVSADTHHAVVAESAIRAGASYINDVYAGMDKEMWSVIKASQVKYVMMYSRCQRPHSFDEAKAGDIISNIISFFIDRLAKLKELGVKEQQIILDPGMGAFVHEDKQVSWDLIHRYKELCELGYPLLLAASRKGFLKEEGEEAIIERDPLSALAATLVAKQLDSEATLYVRVHNIKLHQSFLEKLR